MPAKKQLKGRIFPTIAAAAAAIGKPVAELRSAKNAGCPAFRSNGNVGEVELRAWLKKSPKASPPPEMGAIGKSGTNEALRRLEEAEAYAHAAFIGARDSKKPDASVVEERQRQWISLAKELRTFSAAMDGGADPAESIPRPEVVLAVRSLVAWQRAAFSDMLHNVVPRLQGATSAREVAAIFEQPARESLAMAMQLGQRSGKLPAWMAEAAMMSPDACPDLDAAAIAGIVGKINLSKAERTAIDSVLKKLGS